MKKLIVLLFVLFLSVNLFAAISYEECVKETAEMISTVVGKKTSVAFVSMDADSEAFSSRFMTDVEEALMNLDCIVLSRKNLDSIVKELEFQTSGLVDDNLAVSIGHMAGAELIIVGEAVNNTSSYHVEVSLLDVETTLTKRRKSFDLSYNQNLRNIIKGSTANVGNQHFSVGVRGGLVFQSNKGHEDMVGDGIRPVEKSVTSFAPTIVASYRVFGNLKIQAEASFLKNGLRIERLMVDVLQKDNKDNPITDVNGDVVYKNEPFNVDIQYGSIDIPLVLSWNFIQDPVSVDVFGGAYVSLPTSVASLYIENCNTHVKTGGAIDARSTVFGVVGGFDVGFDSGPGKLVLDARYCYDLKNSTGYSMELLGGEQGLMYRKYFGISVGYVFDI